MYGVFQAVGFGPNGQGIVVAGSFYDYDDNTSSVTSACALTRAGWRARDGCPSPSPPRPIRRRSARR